MMKFSGHLAAQSLAREAMARTAAALRPGMSEKDVAALAEQVMYDLGAERFWYHGVGALVLVGRAQQDRDLAADKVDGNTDGDQEQNQLVEFLGIHDRTSLLYFISCPAQRTEQ